MQKFVILFLTLSCGMYLLVPNNNSFLFLLGLVSIQFGLYLYYYRSEQYAKDSLVVIIALAVVCRAILWFSDPILENDYFRYLWDGRVLAHGFNPYLFSPNATELDELAVWYREFIGWPDIKTIYPPLAQYFFAILHHIAQDSLLLLKITLSIFEIATVLVLIKFTQGNKSKKLLAFLFLFNPLLLKEVANSAHLDIIAVFFCTLAVLNLSASQSNTKLAWIFLALAVLTKSYPLVLVPLFIKQDLAWKRNLLLFFSLIALGYLPFLDAGASLFSGASAFGTYWHFNAGLFKLIDYVINAGGSLLLGESINYGLLNFIFENEYLTKLLLGTLYLVFVIHIALKTVEKEQIVKSALLTIGGLLLISPVVNAWYVLWILPFACLTKSIPWLAFTYLVFAAYAWHWSPEYAWVFRTVEYVLLFCLLFLQYKRGGKFSFFAS